MKISGNQRVENLEMIPELALEDFGSWKNEENKGRI